MSATFVALHLFLYIIIFHSILSLAYFSLSWKLKTLSSTNSLTPSPHSETIHLSFVYCFILSVCPTNFTILWSPYFNKLLLFLDFLLNTLLNPIHDAFLEPFMNASYRIILFFSVPLHSAPTICIHMTLIWLPYPPASQVWQQWRESASLQTT